MAGMCRLLHQARTRLTQRPGGTQGLKALNMSQREQLTAAAPTANASCEEAVMKGWFSEVSDEMWPGQAMSLKIDEVLFRGKSDFQDVMVFQSAKHGRVLILDGVIQATERDEFSYQEMITNLPLCSLKDPPKKVLVVGGGDGGVLREIVRHPTIEHLDIAEIDGMVIEMSKKYFPGMSCGFDDDRVHVHVTDGIKFVGDTEEGTYDAIIVDSSDPVGPAAVLFERAFFEKIHRALKPGGVVCTQGECIWLHAELIKDVLEMCKDIFKNGSVQYGFTTIPTYPSGQIGFVMACKPDENGKTATFVKPERPPPVAPESTKLKPLRYYNSAVHSAAFVLPEFARAAVEPFVVPGTGFQ